MESLQKRENSTDYTCCEASRIYLLIYLKKFKGVDFSTLERVSSPI